MVVLLRMEEKKTNGTEQSGRHRKQKKKENFPSFYDN
jgi:hypothetical protein